MKITDEINQVARAALFFIRENKLVHCTTLSRLFVFIFKNIFTLEILLSKNLFLFSISIEQTMIPHMVTNVKKTINLLYPHRSVKTLEHM